MLAAYNGYPSIVQKLLAAGADPTLTDQVRAAAAVWRGREGAVWGQPGWGRVHPRIRGLTPRPCLREGRDTTGESPPNRGLTSPGDLPIFSPRRAIDARGPIV